MKYFILYLKAKLKVYPFIAKMFSPFEMLSDWYYRIDNKKLFKKLLCINLLSIFLLVCSYFIAVFFVNYTIRDEISDNRIIAFNIHNNEIFIGALFKEEVKNQVAVTNPELNSEKILQNEVELALATTPEAGKVNLDFRAPTLSLADQQKPKLSIIVTNLGLNMESFQEVLKLNNKITLGISPYADELGKLVDEAVNKKFEVLINLPLEPVNFLTGDPGPYALLNLQTATENLSIIERLVIDSFKSVGFYTIPDDNFTNHSNAIVPVFRKLSSENFILVYGNIDNAPKVIEIADSTKLELKAINLIVDQMIDRDYITTNLNKLKEIALAKGSAVGYISANIMSMQILNNWLLDNANAEFILVPISNQFEKRNLDDGKFNDNFIGATQKNKR